MVVYARYPLAETRGERQALAAIAAGYDVDVISARGRNEPLRERCDGVNVYRVPVPHVKGAGFLRALIEYVAFAMIATMLIAVRHFWRHYATVQVHAPPDFLVVSGLLPKVMGARLMLDIHDLSPHMAEARYRGWGSTGVVRTLVWVERASCAAADVVTTVHEPYRQELLKDGVSTDVVCVMNGPDERLIERALATAAQTPTEPGFVVAYHGTINHWYGVDLILEAIAQLRAQSADARGLVLGDGDALSHVRELAASLGLRDWVEFSDGFVPVDEALVRIRHASCGVIPNRPTLLSRFALSTKLLEYVALEIPVVVTRLAVLARSFDDDEVTFFEPGDPRSMADALLWVARNPDAAKEKAKRARARGQTYSWAQSRVNYLAALNGAKRSTDSD